MTKLVLSALLLNLCFDSSQHTEPTGNKLCKSKVSWKGSRTQPRWLRTPASAAATLLDPARSPAAIVSMIDNKVLRDGSRWVVRYQLIRHIAPLVRYVTAKSAPVVSARSRARRSASSALISPRSYLPGPLISDVATPPCGPGGGRLRALQYSLVSQ